MANSFDINLVACIMLFGTFLYSTVSLHYYTRKNGSERILRAINGIVWGLIMWQIIF